MPKTKKLKWRYNKHNLQWWIDYSDEIEGWLIQKNFLNGNKRKPRYILMRGRRRKISMRISLPKLSLLKKVAQLIHNG